MSSPGLAEVDVRDLDRQDVGAQDIGHPDAASWLSGHGAEYGLGKIYKNEPWHCELRPKAIDRGCPHVYADPTRDPRMQQ